MQRGERMPRRRTYLNYGPNFCWDRSMIKYRLLTEPLFAALTFAGGMLQDKSEGTKMININGKIFINIIIVFNIKIFISNVISMQNNWSRNTSSFSH